MNDKRVEWGQSVSENASDLMNIRPIINPECMESIVCWFTKDPTAMSDPETSRPDQDERYVEMRIGVNENEFWEDLASDDDEDDIDIGISDEEADAKIAKLHESEKRWRQTGHNSNVRGAGSSRSTFFANQARTRALANDAMQHSQPIGGFFTRPTGPPQIADDVVREEDQSDEEPDEPPVVRQEYEYDDDEFDDLFGHYDPGAATATSDFVKLTVEQGIRRLNEDAVANPSRNIAKEKKIDLMAWQRLQATAVLSYLTYRHEGEGKMNASAMVAKVIYSKTGTSSYKARAIRF